MYRKWTVGSLNADAVNALVENGADPVAAKVLASRGITEPSEYDLFISEGFPYFDPFELTGMREAVERIKRAVSSGEKILVFGDYDCDGVTATALMCEYLGALGANVIFMIPDREGDGYGLNTHAIDIALADDVSLIITVDNGINCCRQADYARSMGMDIVITDHHMPLDEMPRAVAVVDPHLPDNPEYFSVLAGVGVAFMLACALSDSTLAKMVWKYGDLVALGTVADVMPLTGINRSLVKNGLNAMNANLRPGLSSLLADSGYVTKEITSSTISFTLSPRINAAGRMGTALTALDLLLTTDPQRASVIAADICERNVARQHYEQKIVAEATDMIENENMRYDKIIVVSGENWHKGVVGIAAARLAERYGRPAIVLSRQGSVAVGSGRGIAGFSLFDALSDASELLVRFGGHELAAGLTVECENIPKLREHFNNCELTENMPFPTVRSDCALSNSEMTLDSAYALEELEPFGAGNPVPVFLLKGMKVEKITPLSGGNHQKLTLSREGDRFQALLFGVKTPELLVGEGDTVDAAVQMSVNEYKGSESLSLQIKAIRRAGAGGSECEAAVRRYEAFRRGSVSADGALEMIPSRDDFTAIYRFLSERMSVPAEAVGFSLGKKLGFDKAEVCLDVFLERGLISRSIRDGAVFYDKNPVGAKVSLEDSPVMKQLAEISGKEEMTV